MQKAESDLVLHPQLMVHGEGWDEACAFGRSALTQQPTTSGTVLPCQR